MPEPVAARSAAEAELFVTALPCERCGETQTDWSLAVELDYLNEGIDVLAARAPSLKSALLAAKAADYSHINIDGTRK